MSLNCKALVNVSLYFRYNIFELSCANIYELRQTMMYGDFENCFYKLSDEDRKQRIVMDASIETFIESQLDIKRNMISKWGCLCERVMTM